MHFQEEDPAAVGEVGGDDELQEEGRMAGRADCFIVTVVLVEPVRNLFVLGKQKRVEPDGIQQYPATEKDRGHLGLVEILILESAHLVMFLLIRFLVEIYYILVGFSTATMIEPGGVR